MSVQLIMWESMSSGLLPQPCYYNFVKRIDHAEWRNSNNQDRIDLLNQMLTLYQARVARFNLQQHIVFEFDTQEDLTQFVLAWS